MSTILLVVDAQEGIVNDKLYAFEKFETNVKKLITEARNNNIEVIHIRHDDGEGHPLHKGNTEFEIYSGFAPVNGEKIFDKTVNSPFRNSGLLKYLRDNNVKKIITAGLQTDYCMDANIKCGFEHGFEMIVPEYCNSTFDNDFMTAEQTYRYYNNFMWNKRYAECVDMDRVVELIGKGDKNGFKL